MLERTGPLAPIAWTLTPRLAKLARRLVLDGLRRLAEGHVTMRLPDGEVRELGDASAPAAERAVIHVLDDAFFLRVLLGGELAAGEAYVDQQWRADDLTQALRLFLRNLSRIDLDTPLARLGQLGQLVAHRLRGNTRDGSKKNIAAHYDLGNDFYRLWLDESMAYSCAVFAGGDDSLEAAQRRKFELICDKLRLGAGEHLLEVGSGWGGFAVHAARTRGCRVTTVTVSAEQERLARARAAEAGVGHLVEVQYRDYRDVAAPPGGFDKIVSIEMFEAVGPEHYRDYFARVGALLARRGLFLLQTISMPEQRFERYRKHVDWTQTYIFPGAVIPSLGAIVAAAGAASALQVEHVEEIGPHYAPTLREWRRRFFAEAAAVRALGFDDRFIRTWELYLCFSEAAFAERTLGDLQILFRDGA